MQFVPDSQREVLRRTMKNLDFVDKAKSNTGPFEVTQVVLSLLTVLAYPREQYLRKDKLRWVLLSDELVTKEMGFPGIKSSWEFDTEEPKNLDHLIRLLRNGVAHGNIEFLNFDTFASRTTSDLARPSRSEDIFGIEIWNENNNKRTWGALLSESDLRQLLVAMNRLVECEDFVSIPRSSSQNGGRDNPPRTASAPRKAPDPKAIT